MHITKLGHCCFLIEENDVRILTDPGNFTTAQNDHKNIDIILITHEHADHCHIDSLKAVLKNNPQATVITHAGVGTLLSKENIPFTLLEDGNETTEKNVHIEGIGKAHAVIYPKLPSVINTGYMIGGRLFFPGDAFTDPKRPVDILMLPVAGPWMKIGEAIDYALTLRPKTCLPMHDGMLKSPGPAHFLPEKFLKPEGIAFVAMEIGRRYEV